MPELSDFHLGSEVVDSEGQRAGTLVSVIVDEEGLGARAVVVKDGRTLADRLISAEKLFTTDEVIVPIASVESATGELVRLSMSGPDIRRQPLYLSYRPRTPTAEEAAVEEAAVLTGGLSLPVEEQVANKPEGEIEIGGGENVMLGATGRRLGTVRNVMFDRGRMIGVVIRPDGWFKRDVMLPVRFIERGDDLALFAKLEEADIESLKPFIDREVETED
jgi:sporulation protein YlmC with PRC-barrel domain